MELHQYLEDFFGLKVVAIKNLGTVWQVHSECGFYALKWWQGTKEDLELMLCACEHLDQNGYSLMAKPIGFGVWQGKCFYLTPWLIGAKADFRVPDVRAKAIRSLAKMHKAGEGFMPPSGLEERRNHIGVWQNRFSEHLDDLVKFSFMAASGDDDFDRLFGLIAHEAIKNGKQALRILTNQGYAEYIKDIGELSPICHGDFVWHNVVVGSQGCCLLDFDNMARDSRIADVARLLRTGSSHCRWPATGGSESLMYYNRAYPLSLEEREYLWAFVEFPHNIWRLGNSWYIKGKKSAKFLTALSLERDLLHYESSAVKFI